MRPLPACRGAARWVAAALLLVATPAEGAAQAAELLGKGPMSLQGTELFRAVLHAARIKPLTHAEFNSHGADQGTILVIMGRRPEDDAQGPWELHAGEVIAAGGAVLYASDTDSSLGSWLPVNQGLQLLNDRVWAINPSQRHSEYPNCPFLVPRTPPPADASPVWELFRGLDRVVAEEPGCFVVFRYGGAIQHPVARFPSSARFAPPPRRSPPGRVPQPDVIRQADPNRWPIQDRNPFAVAGVGPAPGIPSRFRFLAVADQAVYLNRLIADPSTDNLELARRTVAFLQDRGGVNRVKCLFVQNGRVVDRFDTAYRYAVPPAPLPPLMLPPWEKVEQMAVDLGNRAIDHAQESDALNRMVLGPPDEPLRRQRNLVSLIQGLLLAAGVWAVVFVLRRVWKARQPGDQPRPPAVGGAPKPGPPGIFNRREQELLRRNNLYEPVRDLLRDFFTAAGAPPDAGRTPLRLAFEGAGGKPARLRKAIDDLWRIAFGRPAVVTVHQWQDLEPKFELVRQAFEDGTWRFESAAAATGRGDG